MSKRLLSMHAENFLSLRKVDLDLTDAGLTLIEGPNGRGKSALIDAVVWCLYGITLRGYENDEVVHRQVGKDCLVTVQFSDGDAVYQVSRHRKHSKFKNLLVLTDFSCSVDLSKPSVTETQELLDQLLGCSKRTFLSSVVFGQDRAYRFSSLTDKEQKDILDEVLGVERFADAGDAARKQASSIEASLATIQRDFERAEEARDDAEASIADLKKKDRDFDISHEARIKVENDKLLKAKGWLADNVTVDVTKLKTQLDKARAAVTACEKASTEILMKEAEARAARINSKAKLDELTEHVQRHMRLVGDCPTCGQTVDKKQRDAVVKDFGKQLKAEQLRFDTVVKPAHDQTMLNSGEAGEKLKAARAQSAAAERVHSDAIGSEANAKAWRSRVDDHKERLAAIENEENPYAALAAVAEKKRDRHAKEAGLLLLQVEAEEARLKTSQFWVQAFGARGLRSLLLDSSLPLLNQEARRVSRMITDGEIEIEFSTTSELKSGKTVDRFDVRVDNKQGAGSYAGNSSGERARVDLCVGLALQRLVSSRSTASFNVVFMDEIFDHLDSSAHERVVEVLGEIDKESVFVISHDENLKAWFPASITLLKEDGFSRIDD